MSTVILGVRFFKGSPVEAVEEGLRGGLVVVPSAPVMVSIGDKPALRDAVLGADLAITDSGLMVLLWRLLTGEKLVRVSGLEYLKLLLEKLRCEGSDLSPEGLILGSSGSSSPQASNSGFPVSHPAASGVLWIMPTAAARDRNLSWLQANGHVTTQADCHVAPMYPSTGPLSDRSLLDWVRARQPRHIIICLGGGVQERLGYFLKRELERGGGNGVLPGIHCVGAAIGFLSGDQVRIPMWADYLYLGWLFRCISAPRHFMPRYWKAVRLVWLLLRYGKEAPPA